MVFKSKTAQILRNYLADAAAAQLKVLLLDGTIEGRGLFPHIASRTFIACIYIVAGWPGPFFSKRWCSRGDPLIQSGGTLKRYGGGPQLLSLIFLPLTRP